MIKQDWIRSNRKTMSIQIKTDGKVIVRTPYGISKYQVQMFIEEKKQWIEKHLKEISERQMSNKILSEEERDRKSVVQGKSVDLGGRRIIKKKNFFFKQKTAYEIVM